MFGMEGNLGMIKKKVSKTKAKAKAKLKVKSKEKTKKIVKKIKNPVYIDLYDKIKKAFDNYRDLRYLTDEFVSIHSNAGIICGLLISEKNYDGIYFHQLDTTNENVLKYLNLEIFTLKTSFNQMPNRDDLSLIAEIDDYSGNELFWEEYDEFRKDKFKKSTDFQFILGNVDKVDVENNRIYVRRLKQVKSKND